MLYCESNATASDTHILFHAFSFLALLYLADPQVRPGPLDTIVVTVYSDKDDSTVLAGAKIPVSRARFPVTLRLFSQNIIDADAWKKQAGDLVVRAVVCPSTAGAVPCDQSTMQAQGVAKMIRNLPGMPEGAGVRAAAALPLK